MADRSGLGPIDLAVLQAFDTFTAGHPRRYVVCTRVLPVRALRSRSLLQTLPRGEGPRTYVEGTMVPWAVELPGIRLKLRPAP